MESVELVVVGATASRPLRLEPPECEARRRHAQVGNTFQAQRHEQRQVTPYRAGVSADGIEWKNREIAPVRFFTRGLPEQKHNDESADCGNSPQDAPLHSAA